MPRDSLHLATGTSLGSISAEGLWSVSLFKKKMEIAGKVLGGC